MYDPIIGRWLAPDPIGIKGSSGNLYRYVRNDPVNLTDPSGLDPQTPGEFVAQQLAKGDAQAIRERMKTDEQVRRYVRRYLQVMDAPPPPQELLEVLNKYPERSNERRYFEETIKGIDKLSLLALASQNSSASRIYAPDQFARTTFLQQQFQARLASDDEFRKEFENEQGVLRAEFEKKLDLPRWLPGSFPRLIAPWLYESDNKWFRPLLLKEPDDDARLGFAPTQELRSLQIRQALMLGATRRGSGPEGFGYSRDEPFGMPSTVDDTLAWFLMFGLQDPFKLARDEGRSGALEGSSSDLAAWIPTRWLMGKGGSLALELLENAAMWGAIEKATDKLGPGAGAAIPFIPVLLGMIRGRRVRLPKLTAAAAEDAAAVTKARPFWRYASKSRGIGHFEFTPGYSTRKLAGNPGEIVVYWVVDTKTGQVLKVGETTVGGAPARWGQYVGKAKAEGKQIAIDYARFEPNVPRIGPNSPENLLRGEFERQGHQLPWDRSGKRDPGKFPEVP